MLRLIFLFRDLRVNDVTSYIKPKRKVTNTIVADQKLLTSFLSFYWKIFLVLKFQTFLLK